MKRLLLYLALAWLCLGAAHAQADLMEKAEEAAQKRDFTTAVDLCEQAVKSQPGDARVLDRAARIAADAGRGELSVRWLEQYHKLEPSDYRALNRLIVAAQAAGNAASVEAAISDMRALWKSGKDAYLSRQPAFIRDIFTANGEKIVVFERFAPDMSKNAHIWDFMIIGSDNKPQKVYFVEYDPGATKLRQASGQKDAQVYFFDLDLPGGSHATFLHIDHRPDYAEAKRIMQPLIEGKRPPTSGAERKQR